MTVSADDLLGNWERSTAFEWADRVQSLKRPPDRTRWLMTPQSIGANHIASRNQVMLAAAILSPPFFDPAADPAVNYGGIGAVIGHEITHSLDDQGRRHDAEGMLRDWWTAEDASKFEQRSGVVRAQFSNFEPLRGRKLNGALTIGENLSDLGGLAIAYDAYHASLGKRRAPMLSGLTGDQRFFLGWAQIWRAKYKDARFTEMIRSDVHALGQYRVNGPVQNLDAWYRAFNVRPHNKLYVAPAKRARVW